MIYVPRIVLCTEIWRLDCLFSPDDLYFYLDIEHGLCPRMHLPFFYLIRYQPKFNTFWLFQVIFVTCNQWHFQCNSQRLVCMNNVCMVCAPASAISWPIPEDVIKWKHFPRYWPLCVNSRHKGKWRGALMFSLICILINGWINTHEPGDSRRHRAHCDVIVMSFIHYPLIPWLMAYTSLSPYDTSQIYYTNVSAIIYI